MRFCAKTGSCSSHKSKVIRGSNRNIFWKSITKKVRAIVSTVINDTINFLVLLFLSECGGRLPAIMGTSYLLTGLKRMRESCRYQPST